MVELSDNEKDENIDLTLNLDVESDISNKVKDIINEKITPIVSRDGGEVIFHGLKDKQVVLEFKGSAFSLIAGIQNMISHFVPEIDSILNYLDVLPKPGLNTPQGAEIQKLLDNEINPSVAMHGGHISLIDVKDDTAFIRLEGGCQGCGMADVTLKEGIEVTIKNAIPAIKHVLDTTDHAEGKNPYFQG